MLRSYILAGDTAHYDHVIRRFEAAGMRVIPAFAGGLDSRPAIQAYHYGQDRRVGLFDGVFTGWWARLQRQRERRLKPLVALDVPYIAAQPLEFQTLSQWANGGQGLSPIEATMLVALPEIDGATNPTVFAGRHGPDGCDGCAHACKAAGTVKAMAPCPERIDALVEKTRKLAVLRRKENFAEKTLASCCLVFRRMQGRLARRPICRCLKACIIRCRPWWQMAMM